MIFNVNLADSSDPNDLRGGKRARQFVSSIGRCFSISVMVRRAQTKNRS
ncbi:hypothetical protein NSMM_380120 [Nitrosomonas mobilis]|uniref:Uncharacterized protein n=1 Tax=Nitrosomonas mobilis TaxID=51642 RepID=A0A1G5SEG4_9PROT|nr:hypothetical protein NSMM_380120 [Nitrosomonas mobilis]